MSRRVQKLLQVTILTGIIDEERKVKHRKFSERVEEVITKPEKINPKLKSDSVDIAYPPVVQSGGTYDLRSATRIALSP